MGNWWSGEQSAHNLPEQENEQLNQLQPVNVAVDLRALKAYEDYVKGLSSLNMYTFDFTFSHYDAYGLTEDEFHALMNDFKIPESICYGKQTKCVFLMYAEANAIKKTMLIFVRSKGQTYDVLVAEVTMQGALSTKWLAFAPAGTSVLVSGALYSLNYVAGLLSGAVCTVTTSGKVVYEKSHHDFQDVAIGYIMRQLIDAKNLMVTSTDELTFIHNGQLTTLRNPPDDINEGTDADNAWESVATQSTPACH